MNKIKQGDECTKSKNLVTENIQKLKELFPQIVKEDKVCFDSLKEILGGGI
ncbi:MAG: hypothetical protein OXC64_01985 [Flavobacteriaceae bacterium]|nr:hypothetical protein [Flavobacteriaceae bacterium]